MNSELLIFNSGRIKLLLPGLLFLTLLFSCSNKPEENHRVVIEGKINHLASGTVSLEQYVTIAPREINKSKIEKNGTFRIECDEVTELGFYRLSFESPEYRNLANDFINLVLDSSSEIKVMADAPQIESTFSVEGSDDTRILKRINEILKTSFAKLDTLSAEYNREKSKKNISLDSLSRSFQGPYASIVNVREDSIRDLILENPSSISILTAITYLDKKNDLESYLLVDKSLQVKYPEHPYVKDFHRKVQDLTRLAPGSPAPEIIMGDLKGNEHRLSEYKGKIILLTFWGSWNWPSRQEFGTLKKFKKNFKKKDFEIISVGIEKDKLLWTKAQIEEDISWPQWSELNLWDSQAAKQYDVKVVPAYFLIDGEGKIIQHAERISQLEKDIDGLFKTEKP